jgi:hypothetical protein
MPHEDQGFNQVRVTELVDIEFDVDPPETYARLLIRSRTGDQLAVELPFAMWSHVADAFAAGLKEFPGGYRKQ